MTARKITGKYMTGKEKGSVKPESSLESWAKSFTDYCLKCLTEATQKVFEIDSPVSLPIYTSTGYKTKAFIGGEAFFPTGVYFGKAGKAIYRFVPARKTSEFNQIEVISDKIDGVFPRFGEWKEAVDQAIDEDAREKARLEADRLEDEAYEEARTAAMIAAQEKDDRYGSW